MKILIEAVLFVGLATSAYADVILPDGLSIKGEITVWNEEEDESICYIVTDGVRDLAFIYFTVFKEPVVIQYPCTLDDSWSSTFSKLQESGALPKHYKYGGTETKGGRFVKARGYWQFVPIKWPGYAFISYERACGEKVAYWQLFNGVVKAAVIDWNTEKILASHDYGYITMGTDYSGAYGKPIWNGDCSEVSFPENYFSKVVVTLSVGKGY